MQLVFSSTCTQHHAAAVLDSHQILNFQVTTSFVFTNKWPVCTRHLDMWVVHIHAHECEEHAISSIA